MYEVVKRISFCYGHRLLKHPGRCAQLHGHNAIAEIHCQTDQLNEQGMVVDFDVICNKIGKWIDENLDHRMILNAEDELIIYLKEKKEPHFSLNGDPTAENIARLVYEKAKEFKLPIRKVILWETPTSNATYIPS